MSTENLWGELPPPPAVRTPLTVFREQARHLKDMTKGALEGRVENVRYSDGFVTRLIVAAPALDNYTVTVVSAHYQVTIYPLKLRDEVTGTDHEVPDEEAFIARLGETLTSAEVRSVIHSLLIHLSDKQK